MKALADFLHEDRYEAESIADTGDYEMEEKSEKRPSARKKTTAQRFQETEVGPTNVSVSLAPASGQTSQSLTNACNALIRESITFEYSLRPLGAGGPGMYGAWVLRRSLRAFSDVVESCNVDELHQSFNKSDISERHRLGPFIDELPAVLYGLWKAFDELESFLLDFVSFFHSVDLTRVFQLLKESTRFFIESQDQLSKPCDSERSQYDLIIASFFSELEKSFQIFSSELSEFRRQGVPLIRTSQSNQSDRYLMFTTISTFFSAVTSATLQISFQEGPDSGSDVLNTAVNLFFFSSLIFSTASAVQALLAMAWIRSFIRVPRERLAYQWVSKGPLFSLVVSGVFFAIGLCLFVIASQKDSPTAFFTIIFALMHAIGLVVMSVWFVYEQWRFRRQSGAIGRKLTESSVIMSMLAWVMKIWQLHILVPSKQFASLFPRLLPDWRQEVKNDCRLGDVENSIPKEDRVSDADSFEVEVEPPSRPESIMSFIDPNEVKPRLPAQLDSLDLQAKYNGKQRRQDCVHLEDVPVRFVITAESSDDVLLESISGDIHASEEDRWTSESTDKGHMHTRPEPEPKDTSMSWNAENSTVLGTSIVEEPSVAEALHTYAGPSSAVPLPWPDAQLALPDSQTSDFLQVRKESWQEGLRQDSITYMEMYNRRNPKRKRTYPSLDSPSPS
ncbi:hypothetical protein ACEPAF_5732 [Sanghuangporus sanghuang]